MAAVFWDASYQGDTDKMREIIEHDPSVVNQHPPFWKSAYQPTALAYAVWGNQPSAVRLLLESGADPNLPDGDNNYRPLHWTSYKSDTAECAQLLVDAGAEVNVPSARGFTPLEMAKGHNNVVSSKPGVAAVLEDAVRHPRPAWRPPGGAPSGATASTVASTPTSPAALSAPGGSPAAVGAAMAMPALLPAAITAAPAPAGPPATASAAPHATATERAPACAQSSARVTSAGRGSSEHTRSPFAGGSAAETGQVSQRVSVTWAAIFSVVAVVCVAVGKADCVSSLSQRLCLLATLPLLCVLYHAFRGIEAGGLLHRLTQALHPSEQQAAPPTPAQFLCPITGEIMRDPVTTADGHTFERRAIERWLLAHSTSPMTGTALPHKGLVPAIAVRQLIAAHKNPSSRC